MIKETRYICSSLKHSKEMGKTLSTVQFWQHMDHVFEAQADFSYVKPKAAQHTWKLSMGFAIIIFTTQISSVWGNYLTAKYFFYISEVIQSSYFEEVSLNGLQDS